MASDEIATRWAGALIAATFVGALAGYATNAQPLAVAGGTLVAVLIGFAPNRSLGPVLLLFGLLYFCATLAVAAFLDPFLPLHPRATTSLSSLLLLDRTLVFRTCTIATSYALMLTGIVAYVRGVLAGQPASSASRTATALTVAAETPDHVIVVDPRTETPRFERRRFRQGD